ncbi:complement component C9 [Narcine bancroftii]|uniref:complement component C9 n=1 Tax=Narcine bancroftii TaxID=1343680 RepID=UPI0038312645
MGKMVTSLAWLVLAVHLLVSVPAARPFEAEDQERSQQARASPLRRTERAVITPGQIPCELEPWTQWSSCQPCKDVKYRSRSIGHFGQFGGRVCTDILFEERLCTDADNCEEEPVDCGVDFQCENGNCVKQRLKCNNDDDCGDFSDEDECESFRPVCQRNYEFWQYSHVAGVGMNIMGMTPTRSPFNNNFFNGKCELMFDGNRRKMIRSPWNTLIHIQNQAKQYFTTEVYESSSEVVKKIMQETTSSFNVGLTLNLKLKKVDISAGGGYASNSSKSLETLIKHNKSDTNEYFRIKGQVELVSFDLRSHRYELNEEFLLDLRGLPTEYGKGVYFRFLEDYGTHYVKSGTLGGDYQLVYVLDKFEMLKEKITSEHVKECMGFNAFISIQPNIGKGDSSANISAHLNTDKCKKISKGGSERTKEKPLVKDVLSFVNGGTVSFLSKFHGLLSQGHKLIDPSLYMEWAASLLDSPVLVKQKLLPIYNLVPITLRNATVIRNNLQQAIEAYTAEYSVCKCKPCMNGGTVVQLDGQCHCLCRHSFQGVACETPKATHKEAVAYTDGHWSCWSAWTDCISSQRHRSRQCLGRQGAGTDCQGEAIGSTYC